MEQPIVNVVATGTTRDYDAQYKTKVLKANIPFDEQITDENTKYIIRWNFDLGGEEVEIPANCILQFEGGSVKGGLVIANDTVICGNHKDSIIVGTVKNTDGQNLSYNHNNQRLLTSQMMDLTLNKADSYAGNRHSGGIVCDDNYIYQLAQLSDFNSVIVLYTIDGIYIGRAKLSPVGHCNTMTEKDGYLYISHSSTESCIYKVATDVVRDTIRQQETEESLTVTLTPVTSSFAAQAISYDYKSELFYILDTVAGKLYICDSSFGIAFERENPIQICTDYFNNIGYNGRLIYNEFFVKNGLCVIGGNIKRDEDADFTSVICVVDVFNNKVVDYYMDDKLLPNWEIEGISLYKGNDIIVAQLNQTVGIDSYYTATRGGAFVVLSIDSDLPKGYKTNNRIFVDKNFAGLGLGSSANPYKTLIDAISNLDDSGVDSVISIKRADSTYPLRHFSITNKYLNLIGLNDVDEEDESIVYPANAYEGDNVSIELPQYIRFANITFKNVVLLFDNNNGFYNSNIVFEDCVFKSRFIITNSNVTFKNCKITKYIDINNSVVSFEGCTFAVYDNENSHDYTKRFTDSDILKLHSSILRATSCVFKTKTDGCVISGNSSSVYLYSNTIDCYTLLKTEGSTIPSFVLNDILRTNTFPVYSDANSDITETALTGTLIIRDIIKTRCRSNADVNNLVAILKKDTSVFGCICAEAMGTNGIGVINYQKTIDGVTYNQPLPPGEYYYDKDNDRFIGEALKPINVLSAISDLNLIKFLVQSDAGSSYFDTTLGKPIYWNGSAFVDEQGFTATARRGTTRPTGVGGGGVLDAARDIGFEYFDTTLGKPIYVKSIASDGTVTWVDATGTPV